MYDGAREKEVGSWGEGGEGGYNINRLNSIKVRFVKYIFKPIV